MNGESGKKGGATPQPETPKPPAVPRPANPFAPRPAYYKPDEVIKTWKLPAEKRGKK